jgi:uncharacterized surface protein with fasciclin (FAS1) repeats
MIKTSVNNVSNSQYSVTKLGLKTFIFFFVKILLQINLITMTSTKNIVEIASESAKTLTTIVGAAYLVNTSEGTGPFTVFALTDAAFAAVQKDVDNLLMPENKATLAKVLTYHVVSGKHMGSDLTDGTELTTLQGEKLKVSVKDDKVMIGEANVTTADVSASNGVIHIIDKVLMPKM